MTQLLSALIQSTQASGYSGFNGADGLIGSYK